MEKFDLQISPPIMNAAGMLGFVPDPHGPIELDRFGAFVTGPVSLKPRSPAQGERYADFPGGFLMHSGHPNPGLNTVLRKYAPRWSRSTQPVLVHLLARSGNELAALVARLEGIEGVMGCEIGLPPDASPGQACELVQAAQGELPIVVRLPLERAIDLASAVEACTPGWISAYSLGPPLGVVAGRGGQRIRGRMYGPAVFPLALAAVENLRRLGLAVIGAGGIYNHQQAEAMLAVGALAVQLDTVLWKGGFF